MSSRYSKFYVCKANRNNFDESPQTTDDGKCFVVRKYEAMDKYVDIICSNEKTSNAFKDINDNSNSLDNRSCKCHDIKPTYNENNQFNELVNHAADYNNCAYENNTKLIEDEDIQIAYQYQLEYVDIHPVDSSLTNVSMNLEMNIPPIKLEWQHSYFVDSLPYPYFIRKLKSSILDFDETLSLH